MSSWDGAVGNTLGVGNFLATERAKAVWSVRKANGAMRCWETLVYHFRGCSVCKRGTKTSNQVSLDGEIRSFEN